MDRHYSSLQTSTPFVNNAFSTQSCFWGKSLGRESKSGPSPWGRLAFCCVLWMCLCFLICSAWLPWYWPWRLGGSWTSWRLFLNRGFLLLSSPPLSSSYINVIKNLLSFLHLMHKALFHRPDGLTSLMAQNSPYCNLSLLRSLAWEKAYMLEETTKRNLLVQLINSPCPHCPSQTWSVGTAPYLQSS